MAKLTKPCSKWFGLIELCGGARIRVGLPAPWIRLFLQRQCCRSTKIRGANRRNERQTDHGWIVGATAFVQRQAALVGKTKQTHTTSRCVFFHLQVETDVSCCGRAGGVRAGQQAAAPVGGRRRRRGRWTPSRTLCSARCSRRSRTPCGSS